LGSLRSPALDYQADYQAWGVEQRRLTAGGSNDESPTGLHHRYARI
jgi:hypothetical protein